jgi:PAS domain S-box-containing protein
VVQPILGDYLETILHSVADGITVQDAEGRLVYANDAAAQMTGFASADELLAAPISEVLGKYELMDERKQPLPMSDLPGRLALQGVEGAERSVCFRIIATGEERWSIIRARPVLDASGSVRFAVNSFQDITALKRVEEALRRSEARYKSLVASTAAIVWDADRRGAYVTPQASWQSYTGQPWEDHAGWGWLDMVHPDDRDEAKSAWSRAIATEEPLAFEGRLWHAASSNYRYFSVRATPLRDESGAVYEWVGSVTDTDEQTRASDSLRFLAEASEILAASLDFEATLRSIAEVAVPRFADWCAVDMAAEDGQIERLAVAHVNPEKVQWAYELQHRYPPDVSSPTGVPNVLRAGVSEFYPDIPWEMIEAAVTDEEQLQLARELQLRSAIIVPLNARGRTLGAISFMWAESGHNYTAQDLSLAEELARHAALAVDNALLFRDEQRLNAELERRVSERTVEVEAAMKELEAFSYSVSHDLRAPLRSIDGFAQALVEDYGETLGDSGKDFLKRIRAASQRMAQLIDDLLQMSRVTRADVEMGPVNLSSIARDVVADLEYTDPGRVVEWTIMDGLTAEGDARLLRIALANLLENAWKFTSKKPSAHVAFGRRTVDGEPVYYVQDDGAGFEMAFADKLFAPFQRLHGAGEFDGSGVGLATVQRIIYRHDGRIWAEGEPGRGATIYFTLGSKHTKRDATK